MLFLDLVLVRLQLGLLQAFLIVLGFLCFVFLDVSHFGV